MMAKDGDRRGGARPGAGRKKTGNYTVRLRVPEHERRFFEVASGSFLIAQALKLVKEKKMVVKVNVEKFTDEEKDRFVNGWQEAGGYMDDADSRCPWFAPWEHSSNGTIFVEGSTPEEWGASWWNECKDEIEELLKQEQEESE